MKKSGIYFLDMFKKNYYLCVEKKIMLDIYLTIERLYHYELKRTIG